jgi:hypothetical protein
MQNDTTGTGGAAATPPGSTEDQFPSPDQVTSLISGPATRGRAIGLLVFATAGPAWIAWGTSGLAGAVTIPAIVLALAAGVGLYAGAVFLFRRARYLSSEVDRAAARAANRVYLIVNVLQVLATVVGSGLLGASGNPEFIPALVCLGLGIHFFPLARIFHLPLYARMATAQCVLALVGAAGALLTGRHGLATIVPAIGAGLTLFAGGFLLLRETATLVRRAG